MIIGQSPLIYASLQGVFIDSCDVITEIGCFKKVHPLFTANFIVVKSVKCASFVGACQPVELIVQFGGQSATAFQSFDNLKYQTKPFDF